MMSCSGHYRLAATVGFSTHKKQTTFPKKTLPWLAYLIPIKKELIFHQTQNIKSVLFIIKRKALRLFKPISLF